MIVAVIPHSHTWNIFQLSDQARIVGIFLTGFVMWLFGVLFAVWPEVRKGF